MAGSGILVRILVRMLVNQSWSWLQKGLAAERVGGLVAGSVADIAVAAVVLLVLTVDLRAKVQTSLFVLGAVATAVVCHWHPTIVCWPFVPDTAIGAARLCQPKCRGFVRHPRLALPSSTAVFEPTVARLAS